MIREILLEILTIVAIVLAEVVTVIVELQY